jgi:hypothetical protein
VPGQSPRSLLEERPHVREVGVQRHERSLLALADFGDVLIRGSAQALADNRQGIVTSLAQVDGDL